MSLSFTVFLPLIAFAPQKFAICFTIGSMLVMGAFFALKGPQAQLESMLAAEVCQPLLRCQSEIAFLRNEISSI